MNTRIFLSNGFTLCLPKGAEVHIHNDNELVFKINNRYLRGVTIKRKGDQYFASLWGRPHLVEFPRGGAKPYPISIL
jgi:hypothetical protein